MAFHISHVQDWWAPLHSSCLRQKHIHCIATCSCGFHSQGNRVFPHGPCAMEESSFRKWLHKVLWKIKSEKQLPKPQVTMSYLVCWFNVSDSEVLNKVKTPFSCSFAPNSYCWAWLHVAWDIPFVTLSQPAWLYHLPISWAPATYSLRGKSGEKEKNWMFCKHYSAIAKTLVCYQHCFSYKNLKHSTIWTATKKINSVPTRPSTGVKRETTFFKKLYSV